MVNQWYFKTQWYSTEKRTKTVVKAKKTYENGREVPEIGRNGRIGGATVSCRDLPGNGRDGERIGAAVSCRELPGNGRNGERAGATIRCNEAVP